jgi:hypothetical protein
MTPFHQVCRLEKLSSITVLAIDPMDGVMTFCKEPVEFFAL